jgi:molybdenum storage protein
MSKIVKEDSDTGRLHIESPLMGESLVSKEFLKRTEAREYFRMQPEINVLKIGGQSIIDRGRTAVLPILDVLIQAKETLRPPVRDNSVNRWKKVVNRSLQFTSK